jgi:hypothetical protein
MSVEAEQALQAYIGTACYPSLATITMDSLALSATVGEGFRDVLVKNTTLTTFCDLPIAALKDGNATTLDLVGKRRLARGDDRVHAVVGWGMMVVLAHFFKASTSLIEMNLSANELSGACLEPLGTALKTNRSLKSLDLGDNCIGSVGLALLVDALQVQDSPYIPCTIHSMHHTLHAPCTPRTIHTMHPYTPCTIHSTVTSHATHFLPTLSSTLLQVNSVLTTLDIRNNGLVSKTIAAAGGMQRARRYRYTPLPDSDFLHTSDGLEVFFTFLETNRTIRKVVEHC